MKITGSAISATGNELDNVITGNTENNLLDGKSGNDTYNAGVGNDKMTDESGNDTYIYNSGYGHDTILDSSGFDVIKFTENIVQEDLVFIKDGDDLAIAVKDENKILDIYKTELMDFINEKKPLIVANGSSINFFNNVDLYGLDMCIELTAKLKKDYPNLGFLFALANKNRNAFYLKKMMLLIKKLKIEENFYFLTGLNELWPIFKKADLLVRPTNTDGDSISIREALYFKTSVVASDVTSRPKECYIFKNRDLRDFYSKSIKVLKIKVKN